MIGQVSPTAFAKIGWRCNIGTFRTTVQYLRTERHISFAVLSFANSITMWALYPEVYSFPVQNGF